MKGKQWTGAGNSVQIKFISFSFVIFIWRKKHLCLAIMYIMLNYSNESNEQLQIVLCSTLFHSFENGVLLTVLFQSNCDNKMIM